MVRDLTFVQWYERIIEPGGPQKWFAAGMIILLVAAVGWLVYATGGTTFVWAHSIYIPILVAALVFRVKGALLTAFVAGLVLGPWMPLDVAAGTPQQTINWVYRLGFLMVIAGIAGTMFETMHHQMSRLRKLAFEDVETDLPNLLSLEIGTRDAIRAADKSQRIYLLSVRIGNFTEIMTGLGPAVARSALRTIANELRELVPPNASVYRMNIDGFGVLLFGASRRQCYELVEQVVSTIERQHLVNDIPIHLDAHVGVASFPFHEASDPEMLVRKSIQALQSAEFSGKRWGVYDAKQDENQQEAMSLLGALRPAMELGQLELHYQPKIALADGAVKGFEALIRWQHPDRGMVPPGLFIPAAEQSGLIHPLTDWVLEEALQQLHVWRSAGLDTSIAINISGRNLADDDFVKRVRSIINDLAPSEGGIEFELTENSLFLEEKSAVGRLNEIRQLGIDLSIDDFGTGYSSLSYLQRLPVSTLKIDRSFLSGFDGKRSASGRIIETSIALARGLDMETVAEGVETADMLGPLREMGCSAFQGYLCSPPMTADQATEWFRTHRVTGWHPSAMAG